jgi:AcrR family transcriptional regulator
MSVSRQADSPGSSAPSLESGRINQKRRTRAAIVQGARTLIAQGQTPTVAQAAEAGLVSRTTAYRYFPTQESLLVEIALDENVDDIEALVADGPGARDPIAHVQDVLDALNAHVVGAQVAYRSALRLYLDQSIAAIAKGDDPGLLREGRRVRWITDALEPLRKQIGPKRFETVVRALSVLAGTEPMVVMRDVCHADDDEARAVCRWVAGLVLEAATAPAPKKR